MSTTIIEDYACESSLPESYPVVDCFDVGYKEDLHAVHNKIDKLKLGHSKAGSESLSWTKVGVLIAAAVGVVALLSWLQPQFSAHRDQDVTNEIKIEVAAQLKEPLNQISDMRSDISEIKGELIKESPSVYLFSQTQRHSYR